MPPSVGAVLTASLVRQFRDEFPNVSLGVMEGFSGHVLEWLTTGRIDVAVLYNAPRTNALVTEPLLTDELFLLGPVGDPAGAGNGAVAASHLARIPLILPSVIIGVPVGGWIIRRVRTETFRRCCMCFDAWIVAFGISVLLRELHLVSGASAFAVLAIVSLVDMGLLYRFFSSPVGEVAMPAGPRQIAREAA